MQATRGSLFVLSVLCLGLFGCNADVQQCAPVAGLYEPLYTYVSGTCGPAIEATSHVNFDSGRHGVITNVQKLPNMWVTTDVILKGCSVHMTQRIQIPEGPIKTQIDGQTIGITDAQKLTGVVTVTQYSPTGEVACQGTYNGMFSKDSQVPAGTVPGFAGSGS